MIVVVIVVHVLDGEEGDIAGAGGGVLIGDVEIAVVAGAGAPGILDDPRAVARRAIALVEVLLGKIVVPAHDGDVMVGIVEARILIRHGGLDPADGAVGGVDAAVIGGAGGIADPHAHRARAVGHDVALDLVHVGAEEVLDRRHVGDVVLIGVLAAQASGIRGAVHQCNVRLVGKTGPSHQRIADQLPGAARLEETPVGMAAQEIRLVAGQHALGVIGVGVGVIGEMVFGQIQALVRRRAVLADVHAVLDHIRLTGRRRAEGPAGIVIALVPDRCDIAVGPAVIARRQIVRLQFLHGKGPVRGIRAAVPLGGQKAQSVPAVFRSRGSSARPRGKHRGDETQSKDQSQ